MYKAKCLLFQHLPKGRINTCAIQTNSSPCAHGSLPGHRLVAEPIGSGVGAARFLLDFLMPRVQKPLPAFHDARAHVLITAEGFWRDVKHRNQR